MRAMRVIGIALGTVRAVESVKEVLRGDWFPWHPPTVAKATLATGLAAGLVVLTDTEPFDLKRFVLEAGAASGAAMMLHELHWYLMGSADGAVLHGPARVRRG